MDARLQQWLLSDEPLPEDVDLDALVEAELPGPPPPPDLFARTLALVEATPQPRASLGVSSVAVGVPPTGSSVAVGVPPTGSQKPANRSMGRWFAAGGLLLAAAGALVMALPDPEAVGNPDDFVARGDAEILPKVDLFAAVREADGSVDRLSRGASYEAGATLVFRYDLERPAHLHLVRVDAGGAALLHAASAGPGTADLQTEGAAVGYELEEGEESAVFALVSSDRPLSAAQIAEGLAVGVDPEAVCAAAHVLGAGCSSVFVGAVR